jgi:hypothetical protein
MNCPGCNHSDWEYPDVAIARCKNCGYLLDPYVFGMKSDTAGTSLDRSENSLRWAKVALGVSILLFVVSIFVPDWEGLWVIGLAASVILWLDHVMYL